MKSFFKDYWELCKESNKWMKKHWKRYLVYCFIVFALCHGNPGIWKLLEEKRLEKFSKEEEENE